MQRDNQENVLPNYSTKLVVVAAAAAAHLRPHNERNITHPQHYSSSVPHLHYLQTHKKKQLTSAAEKLADTSCHTSDPGVRVCK
jgi:hypothetical protein